jgi:hypothetical protein
MEARRVVRRRGSLNTVDNRLTDGGEVVNLRRRSPFTPKKIHGTHFCQMLGRTQGHSTARRITSIGKSDDLIRNRNRDLPACNILPQPTTSSAGNF